MPARRRARPRIRRRIRRRVLRRPRRRIFQARIVCRRGGQCKVVPGRRKISLGERDQVSWRAVNTGAVITFPTTCPFGWRVKTLRRGGRLLSGPARRSCPRPRAVYEYSVFCTSCVRKNKVLLATGGSYPRVIVDP